MVSMSVSVCNCVCVVLAVAALVCLPDCATALFFGRPSAKRPADVLRLTELAQASGRGTISANNQEIIRTVDKLRLQASESSSNGRGNSSNKKSGWNVDYALLDGTWDLLWTTEKETLTFARNGLFGAKCVGITQTIGLAADELNNKILFDGDRYFSVDGTINNQGMRTNFQFKSVSLRIPPFTLPLPPVGKGWFDTIYVDDTYRISYDIRGDYLICKRA